MNDRSLDACFGKQGFKSAHEAMQVAKRVHQRSNARLNAYKCSSCGKVHIGARSNKH